MRPTIGGSVVPLFCSSLLLLAPLAGCDPTGPDDTTPKGYACTGTPSECLRFSGGWAFEGKVVPDGSFVDVCILRLPDGRYRLYGGNFDEGLHSGVLESYISLDGVSFQKEPGYRFVAMLGNPFVIRTADGGYRLYYADLGTWVNSLGNPSIKSAYSADGLTFVPEVGNRLTYSGTGYETNGIVNPKVLALPDGTLRMYYRVGGAPPVLLSARSSDGLNWTREEGTRFDWSAVCPPELGGNYWPFIDSSGVFHLITVAVKCTGDYENPKPGIWDGTSGNGLAFTLTATKIVEGYYRRESYDGNPGDPAVIAQDPAAIQTPTGLRIYFGLYELNVRMPEAGIYAASTTSIR